jgi:hypothetical protein
MTKIQHGRGDRDHWICRCGNTPTGDGFIECDAAGRELEPTVGSGWNGLYICNHCGVIIDQDTLQIVGQGVPPHLVEPIIKSR